MGNLRIGTTIDGNIAWHAGNDGLGSGLDADYVHGYIPLNKAGDTMTGTLTLSTTGGAAGAPFVFQTSVVPSSLSAGMMWWDGTNLNFRTASTTVSLSGGGAVASVTAADSTLTITPNSGAVTAKINLSQSNTWAALQTLSAGLTVTGAKTTVAASAAGYASLNIPSGVVATSPVAGDIYFDGSALHYYTTSWQNIATVGGGATVTVDGTGGVSTLNFNGANSGLVSAVSAPTAILSVQTNSTFNPTWLGQHIFNYSTGATTAAGWGLRVAAAPGAVATAAALEMGVATAFDGSTAGYFSGSSSGTFLAINAASTYVGDLINVGINVSGTYTPRFRVGAAGTTILGGKAQFAASTTTSASLNIPMAANAPSSPNSGDFWWSGTNLITSNGTTRTILYADFSNVGVTALPTTAGGTGFAGSFAANGIAYASSTSALATNSNLIWNGSTLSAVGAGTSAATAVVVTQGKTVLAASVLNYASLNIPTAVNAPTSPITGDIWWNGTSLNASNGTITRTVLYADFSNVGVTALVTTAGGTGLTSFAANGIVYASSTSALATSASLTWSGSVLAVAGALTVTTAKTTLAASAAGYASLNIPAGAAVTSPVSGDIWWDGTALNFRTGSSTANLLSGAVSSVTATNSSLTISPTTGAVSAAINMAASFTSGGVGAFTGQFAISPTLAATTTGGYALALPSAVGAVSTAATVELGSGGFGGAATNFTGSGGGTVLGIAVPNGFAGTLFDFQIATASAITRLLTLNGAGTLFMTPVGSFAQPVGYTTQIGASGLYPPTSSVGYRISIFPMLAQTYNSGTPQVTNRDYAIGVESSNMWFTSDGGFKWYSSNTAYNPGQLNIAALTATGALTISQALTVSAGGAAITGNSTVTGTFAVSSSLTLLGATAQVLQNYWGTVTNAVDVVYPAAGALRFGSSATYSDGAGLMLFSGTNATYAGQAFFDYGSYARTLTTATANWRYMSLGAITSVLTANNLGNFVHTPIAGGFGVGLAVVTAASVTGNTAGALISDTGALKYNTGAAWKTVLFNDFSNVWTTALPTTAGGTGLTSFTSNGILYASSTSVLATSTSLTWSGSALAVAGAVTVTTAKTTLAASAAGYASLNIPAGATVTSPASGDLWWDGTALNFRTGSSTANLLSGAVTSVTAADSTLTITPTTGAVTAKINLGQANTWTALQTFGAGLTATGAKTTFAASAAGYASLNIPSGVVATSPVAGDIYFDGSALHYYTTSWQNIATVGGGATVNVDGTGGVSTLNFSGTNSGLISAVSVPTATLSIQQGVSFYPTWLGQHTYNYSTSTTAATGWGLRVASAPGGTSYAAALELGIATAFDGSTNGFFNGAINGTYLAINAPSAYAGDLINIGQIVGTVYTSRFKVTSAGLATVGGGLTISAGGLTISASGAAITGASSVAGSLTVTLAKTTLAASAAGYASLNIPSGIVATSPVAGDIYFDGTNIYYYTTAWKTILYSGGSGGSVIVDGTSIVTTLNFNGTNSGLVSSVTTGVATLAIQQGGTFYPTWLGQHIFNYSTGTTAPTGWGVRIASAPGITSLTAALEMGVATAFDGSTNGYFNGAVNGTYLAINAPSAYNGDFINVGQNVSNVYTSRFKVTSAGAATIGGGLTIGSGGASITGNSTVTGTLGVTSILSLTLASGAASLIWSTNSFTVVSAGQMTWDGSSLNIFNIAARKLLYADFSNVGSTALGTAVGGTNLTSFGTNGGVMYASGNTALAILAPSTSAASVMIQVSANGVPSWSAGALGVGYGGTGLSSVAQYSLLYGSTATALVALANSSTTGALLMATASGAPSWVTTLPANYTLSGNLTFTGTQTLTLTLAAGIGNPGNGRDDTDNWNPTVTTTADWWANVQRMNVAPTVNTGAFGFYALGSFSTLNQGTGITVSAAYGLTSILAHTGAGTTSLIAGVRIAQSGTASGTITAYNGVRIEKTWSAATVTNYAGVLIDFVGTLATNAAAIYIVSDGSSKTGITWATSNATPYTGEFQLYRSAANTLTLAAAKLVHAASTTSYASLNIPSGAAVSSPVSGDLWWNGTNLYFYNGSTNKDLLAGGSTFTGGTLTGNLTLANGTTALSPLTFQTASAALLTTAAAGNLEYDSTGDRLMFTQKTGPTRKGLAMGSGTANYNAYWSDTYTLAGEQYLATSRGGTGLGTFTANGVVYASSTSALATSSNLTWNGSTLGVTGALTSSSTITITSTVQIGQNLLTNLTNGVDLVYPAAGGLRFGGGSAYSDGAGFQGFSGTNASYAGQMYFDYGSTARNITTATANWRYMNLTSGAVSVLSANNLGNFVFTPIATGFGVGLANVTAASVIGNTQGAIISDTGALKYNTGSAWKTVLFNDFSNAGTTALPLTAGGLGITTVAQYALLYGNNTAGVTTLTNSSTTGALLMATASAAPSWATTLSGAYTFSGNLTFNGSQTLSLTIPAATSNPGNGRDDTDTWNPSVTTTADWWANIQRMNVAPTASTGAFGVYALGSFTTLNQGTGITVSAAYGLTSVLAHTGAGTTTLAAGVRVTQSGTAAGTIAAYNGLRIEKFWGAATITNFAGVFIDSIGSLATNSASIYIVSDGTVKTGITWASSNATPYTGEIQLYRSSANNISLANAHLNLSTTGYRLNLPANNSTNPHITFSTSSATVTSPSQGWLWYDGNHVWMQRTTTVKIPITKRSFVVSFGSSYTPSTGADTVIVVVPKAPDGTTLSWNVVGVYVRAETAGSTASTFNFDRCTSTGAWSTANQVRASGTVDFSLPSSTNELSVTSGIVNPAVNSGDKLRLDWTGVGTGAANFTVEIVIEEQ